MGDSESVPWWILKELLYALTGAATGVASAMAWFRKHRLTMEERMETGQKRVNERIDQVRVEQAAMLGAIAMDKTAIAVLEVHQANNVTRLEDIKQATEACSEKIDDLSRSVLSMLVELRRP